MPEGMPPVEGQMAGGVRQQDLRGAPGHDSDVSLQLHGECSEDHGMDGEPMTSLDQCTGSILTMLPCSGLTDVAQMKLGELDADELYIDISSDEAIENTIDQARWIPFRQ